MKNIKINFRPTQDHLNEIIGWLKEEDVKYDEGFYNKRHTIAESLKKNQLIIAYTDNKVVGFLTYYFDYFNANIALTEIHPDYRRKGIGLVLVDSSLDYLKTKTPYYVELECSPPTTAKFWKKQGFSEYEMLGKTMAFKTFIETLSPTDEMNDNRLELYNVSRHAIGSHTKKWIWDLEFEKGTDKLIKPIIFPAMSFWSLRWVKNGKEIEMDELKHFQNRTIKGASLMIIEELKESLTN